LVAGAGRVETYPIARGRVVIGRAADFDVAIPHAALARHHAELVIGPPLTVRDLGSTNGTRIDRELHRAGAPIAIAIGDSFHIGPFSLSVLDDQPTDGSSAAGRDVLRVEHPSPDGVPAVVRDIARSDVSVLVLGETGVGKELLAQTLHTLSERRGPFQRINCAALAESLVESELFGHEKGAFTGATQDKQGLLEAARGGTVFLDEIGELPLALQAKLLRAVEAGEVIRIGGARPISIDVRYVAATHREPAAEVAAGRFRRDLFYRLDGVSLRIPPLRERRGQIAALARQFATAGAGKLGKSTPLLSHAVLAKLDAYDWPGNVRELKAVVERAVLLAGDREVRPSHVVIASAEPAAASPAVAEPALPPAQAEERSAIIAALEACAGNQTRAARLLGVARSTLATKLALYRVPRPRAR
ncbi:MAG: sigma 54-interacting transcriptional regulator, partial [Kofleriaceae bacterium]